MPRIVPTISVRRRCQTFSVRFPGRYEYDEAGDMVDDFVDQQTDREEHPEESVGNEIPSSPKYFCTSGQTSRRV